ncbi:MAG: S41 family peptidase [Schwartzia sp.]|nr:S41 family peptidase [Schwartzia sp. (in: firmicutes)]MBQ1918162.1 S41 family peptidase [Schwartzia sp. (in: firmicutes)]MBQ2048145.1 S41 family peptidase [Schwartzia sp. (in: firmicutes)]MBQ3863617.1 S41 family peptidase [Schwartzia sp. (in: firmicutes)]MBQ5413370.1 S41 family peptidase [Schwartzia sp. (in: firmicutes)]
MMRFVETQYVDEVSYDKLMNGAISGMIKSLGDPYSVYLDPEMYKKLIEQTGGTFGGIGVVMGFENGVHIMSVLEGTPGEAAGLVVGDEILAVDGTPTSSMDSETTAMSIRGEAGTDVVLSIRHSDGREQEYTITRDVIHVKTAAGRMFDNSDIGYIRIASFGESTAKEFETDYNRLRDEGMKGMIIDMRANPGGYVKTCVDIANLIVPAGPVVSVVQRDGTREEHTSGLSEPTVPIVVLIDGNSASASEILAGALQDTGAATLVGTTSYGKGSVQVVLPMPDRTEAVKLTIARYYTPNGRSINGVGIEPDVFVEQPPEAHRDMQLEKALDVIKEKMKAAENK